MSMGGTGAATLAAGTFPTQPVSNPAGSPAPGPGTATPGETSGSSVLDGFMSDTVGVLWRGVTGTVDPWTKQELVDDASQGIIKAGGDPTLAVQQATGDTTNTLTMNGADPSQASLGLSNSLGSLKTILLVGVGLVGLYLIADFLEVRAAIRG